MFDWILASAALGVLMTMAFATWLVSVAKNDASVVDSVWSLFIGAATWVFLGGWPNCVRSATASVLVMLWAVRLSVFLTWRNWGQPEDRRYQAIRERNQPGYVWKSLLIVFAFQGLLAWIVAWPILPVLKSAEPLSGLDLLGISLFLAGLGVESVADWQMSRFRADPARHGRIMDQGLWRYSRHPNYFGECLLWWGFYLIAAGAGAPGWVIVSPLLMTVLLLKVSGVPLLEADLLGRRPGYRDYIARTSAFIPWPPRQNGGATP